MNNRAIIVKKINNGYFSVWVWTDGSPEKLCPILENYFKTDKDVDELIACKNILGIYEKPEYDKNRVPIGNYDRLSNGIYVKHDDGYKKRVIGSLNGFVPSFFMFFSYDARYIYLFENNLWTTYINDRG